MRVLIFFVLFLLALTSAGVIGVGGYKLVLEHEFAGYTIFCGFCGLFSTGIFALIARFILIWQGEEK